MMNGQKILRHAFTRFHDLNFIQPNPVRDQYQPNSIRDQYQSNLTCHEYQSCT